MELHYRRPDGSFVATVRGLPYHIVDGDPLFEEAQANGANLPLEPIPEPPPLTIDDFRRAIQAHVDATAQSRSYDSGVTCSSYVGSTNEAWAAEATAFVAWRDSVLAHAYVELAKVQGGQRPVPTISALIDELPTIVWPV